MACSRATFTFTSQISLTSLLVQFLGQQGNCHSGPWSWFSLVPRVSFLPDGRRQVTVFCVHTTAAALMYISRGAMRSRMWANCSIKTVVTIYTTCCNIGSRVCCDFHTRWIVLLRSINVLKNDGLCGQWHWDRVLDAFTRLRKASILASSCPYMSVCP
jgi:hypothetical protein